MSRAPDGDVALACCSLLVDELVRGGMEHACLSPGSRSTPIALALARDPRVTVHVHLDERASAFFALGIAKAAWRPVAIACTSGTAAANLFPAIVEASMSRVPLLLLTADRPPELRGVGANQTIDQLGLYGRYVRWFADAEVPQERATTAVYWRSLGSRAAHLAAAHPPGPVHINLPFREPLVPTGAQVDLEDRPVVTPATARSREPEEDDVAALAAAIEATERGIILAGSLREAAQPVLDLANAVGWPLIAEPTSGLRHPGVGLAAGQHLLADAGFAARHQPDPVLQFGAAPTSRAGLAFAASARRLFIVDPDGLVADPAGHAERRIEADANAVAKALVVRPPSRRGESHWLSAWARADATASAAVRELLDSWREPFEGRAARDLAAWIPDGGTLVVGSSMSIRDLDAFMLPRNGLRVLANRGASGIDGFVSTALGVAASSTATFALCGDLTLLHDAGSFLWSAKRGLNAVFVVLNNDGGAVFSFLPQRDLPEHEALFATPHGMSLEQLCGTAGAGYERIGLAGDLVPAVERATTAGGVWVVEVPSERERNVARHAEVLGAVAAALTEHTILT